jgi:hypothetical protein
VEQVIGPSFNERDVDNGMLGPAGIPASDVYQYLANLAALSHTAQTEKVMLYLAALSHTDQTEDNVISCLIGTDNVYSAVTSFPVYP